MQMSDTRVRYDALIQLVTECFSQGKQSKTEWIQEILRVQEEHPEWATQWAPPPPPAPPLPPTPPSPPALIAPPPHAAAPARPGERVLVVVDDDMERVVREVLAVWGSRLAAFQSSGRLLEVQTDSGKEMKFLARERDTPRMIAVGAARARALAARECSFGIEKTEKDGSEIIVPCLPPDWLGSSIVTRPDFPNIPVFSALAQAPTLRSDGALIREPGYDESTGIYLATDLQINIPDMPTQTDAREATGRLLDLVKDFDFVNEGKSVWLAGVLSAACRHTFAGPSPIFIMDASKRGSGKTTLVDLASIIATGSKAPRMFYTDDDTEMDKRITSLALSGEQIVLIDNIVGKLASPPLDAALTSDSYRGRILGKTEMTPAVPMKIVWFATGNGLVIGADTARRSLLARLEPQVDHPEDRVGPRPGVQWAYPDLIGHVTTNRARYLADALTVVRAFIIEGKPKQEFTPMGSFEAWSAIIRSAIVWAGAADPCTTIKDAREADLQDYALRAMIKNWPVTDLTEVNAATLIQWAEVATPIAIEPAARAQFDREKTIREMWRNALLDWLPARKGDLPTARELGYALRSIKGSVVEDYRIESGPHTNSGIPWRRICVSGNSHAISTEQSLLTVIR